MAAGTPKISGQSYAMTSEPEGEGKFRQGIAGVSVVECGIVL